MSGKKALPDWDVGRNTDTDGPLMARTEHRQAALRFCMTALGWIACVFGWAAILSFSSADPPSSSAWPHNSPPANICGSVGAQIAYQLFYFLGAGCYALLALLTLTVFALTRAGRFSDPWLRVMGSLLITASACVLAAMYVTPNERYLVTGPGGAIGTAGAEMLVARFQTFGTLIVVAAALFVGMVLTSDELIMSLARWLMWAGRRSAPVVMQGGGALLSAGAATASGVAAASSRLVTARSEGAAPARTTATSKVPTPPRRVIIDEEEDDLDGAEAEPPLMLGPEPSPTQASPALARHNGNGHAKADAAPPREPEKSEPPRPAAPPVVRTMAPKPPKAVEQERFTFRAPDDKYELPSLTLLDEPTPVDKESTEILCREKAFILEQTLNEFRLEVQVVAIETGPVITVFELRLAPGIKVSQIVSLSNDLARALKAPAVRVVAPLPGKNTIGIEVPNLDKERVRLKDLMRASAARADQYAIPLYLGKDASGQPLVTDLTRMPHLLIAGTTGSGKSVCVSSLVMSVLLARTPSEVNLILVDPKVVELAMFKDVPHLMCPIVTDVTKAESILDWAATKMDERYALLAEAGVKDIRSYNKLGLDGLRERLQPSSEEEMAKIPVHLPYIVIIIDELADLMMTSAKEVEFYLCRLAQKSRAVGIHLIVSTQRPQANVVTGLIKSNLPCRVAFRVASRLDSRIVLDQNGGEVLMGQGDMLFLPPGSSKLMRAQGTFVSDEELRRIVRHCREQGEPQFHPELVRIPGAGDASAEERDELFDQAVDAIIETGRGSVSLLQRRLTIGYGRASRLIDQMYAAGIVGEYKGSQAREVVVSKEEWAAIKAQRNREEAAEASAQDGD